MPFFVTDNTLPPVSAKFPESEPVVLVPLKFSVVDAVNVGEPLTKVLVICKFTMPPVSV